MNKKIMRTSGFGTEVERVESGNCPTCNKTVHPNKEFRDDLSRREFDISGMCQTCQDGVFGE